MLTRAGGPAARGRARGEGTAGGGRVTEGKGRSWVGGGKGAHSRRGRENKEREAGGAPLEGEEGRGVRGLRGEEVGGVGSKRGQDCSDSAPSCLESRPHTEGQGHWQAPAHRSYGQPYVLFLPPLRHKLSSSATFTPRYQN